MLDGTKKSDSGLDLVLRVVGLDISGDHGDKPVLGRHLMSVADHGHVDVTLAVDLLLWNDDLGGQRVFGVRDGVVQQADTPRLPSNCTLVKSQKVGGTIFPKTYLPINSKLADS